MLTPCTLSIFFNSSTLFASKVEVRDKTHEVSDLIKPPIKGVHEYTNEYVE